MNLVVRTPENAPGAPWLRRAVSGVAAASGFLGVCVAVSVAAHHPSTRGFVTACCRYSPDRLARGDVWTVLGSAFFLPDVRMIAPTTLVTGFLFVPYAVAAGARAAVRAFVTGHVLATLTVAVVVIPGAVLGWPPATALFTRSDIGASAGLAAVAGAACMWLGRRRGGDLMLGALTFGFGLALARTRRVVDVEHLLALAVGAAGEWRRRRPRRHSARVSRR